jgi:hypothetical protein
MTRATSSRRCIPISLAVFIVLCGMLVGATANAAGDGTAPVLYASNGVRASVRSFQPAVNGLFQVHAPRVWADTVGEAGAPVANGVPDFLDTWEAFGARTNSAILKSGYAFTTIDGLSHEVLYAGFQRAASGGPSSLVVEFSQKAGERLAGDLRVSADIDAAGNAGPVRFETFTDGAKGAQFLPIAILPTEGCNDAGTACAVANGTLVEFGYNLTILGKPEKEFAGIQITTPEESVVGLFTVNPVGLPAVTCPSNLTSCTANDVTTTVKAVTILNNDLCTSLTDTIQLRITTAYASTSNERFDLGLFVSRDGGTVKEPSSALLCSGAAAQAGQGNNLEYPDADTDLFLSIDPSGHASTPGTTDTCGDLRASAGPVDWTVDATVACNIANGALRIPSCRVWEQNANHKVSCQSLQQAGTGSKCDCSDLVVTTQLNPCATAICNDNSVCTNDSCTVVGTPGNLSAQCIYTPANAGTQCRASGGVCDPAELCDGTNAACPTDSFASNTTQCRASAGVCDAAETCTGSTATCPADTLASPSTVCRASAGDCDVPESCTGSSAICPADVLASSATTCRAAAGVCDVAESCSGSSAACPSDNKSTAQCRASAGDCDLPESCNGTTNDCPADAFKTNAVECRASAGACDLAESCSGSAATCPADTKSTAECRASAGDCDLPESCNGTTNTCPSDAFKTNAVECRAAGGVCDIAESCSGSSAACPNDAKSTAECRASAGVCDLPESCNGTLNDCPSDAFKTNAVECRASGGVCDLAESCTGASAACPDNAFKGPEVVCRARVNSCDADEHCTGSSAACGSDLCVGGEQPISYP